MESLVSWKKKVDKYDDEADGDFIDAREVKLTDQMQDPEFVMRDEHNAEAKKKLGFKQW